MILECSECGDTRWIAEPPVAGRQRRCWTCGIELIFIQPGAASDSEDREKRGLSKWGGAALQAMVVTVVTLFILMMGSSIALAKPEYALVNPFRGITATLMQASSGAFGLIEDVRGVASAYECNIVIEAVQSMRVVEDLAEVPAVTVPTNDMMHFPSTEHALFPDYLAKRYSQFKYTVDSKGIASAGTSGATTDAFLVRIDQLLDRVSGEN